MPGQWEFQIGPVGPLELGDEVMLARWLLHRLGECDQVGWQRVRLGFRPGLGGNKGGEVRVDRDGPESIFTQLRTPPSSGSMAGQRFELSLIAGGWRM